MSGFEKNEISIKANGGTELYQRFLEERLPKDLLENFQIVSSRIREIDTTKIRIFCAHDLALDPESAKFRDQKWKNAFHHLVFVSNYQYAQYRLVHGIPYDTNSSVLETCISPAPIESINKPDGKIHIVYTSSPQRGLEILVPAFESLCAVHDNIHLDVFSSFKIYGWENADKQYQDLFDRITNHPNMTYHGFRPNDEVLAHLNKSHIFAYPSIWEETSCRSMIEAMSAGLLCVHPNYGALPETSGMLNLMYQGDLEDKNLHANIFANYLNFAITNKKSSKDNNTAFFIKKYVDSRYNVEFIAKNWQMLLENLLKKYPTEESRNIPEERFVFDTNRNK